MGDVAVIFLVVGAVGLAVLVASLVLGELDLGVGDADGPFSLPAIAALIGGIGFGGAGATALLPNGLPDAVAVLLALAAGVAVAVPLAWGAIRLSRALKDMPTQETLTRDSVLGAQGVVVSAVPGSGFGEVRLGVAGQHLKFSARSDLPLPAGTPVYVVDTLSDTAVHVVSTAPDLPRPDPEGDPS